MAMPMHFLGGMKASASTGAASPSVGPSGSLNAVAATLRLRRKRPVPPDATGNGNMNGNTNGTTAHASSGDTSDYGGAGKSQDGAAPRQRSVWKNPFSPPRRAAQAPAQRQIGAADSEESDGESLAFAKATSPSLRPKLFRAATSHAMGGAPVPLMQAPQRIQREISAPVTTPLDTVSLESPPHVAVRYGDVIRLYARSKYVCSADTGGYVGTYELGRRFLQSKNPQKHGERACIPPVVNGDTLYRPSNFTILSTCGISLGAPVSYGDVVVLVDDKGRVWNNKIGVGPTTLSGYFGPREQNTPGEMYLSFYQLDDDDSSSISDSDSDDDDSFLSLSTLAKTTKSMAETTFGKPSQMELDLAAAALRTMGRVIYYGDKNLIIDVADSNRMRSKFNRVVTHHRKGDEPSVQGGYLRCDGRGKAIMFEVHGQQLPDVEKIEVGSASDAIRNEYETDVVIETTCERKTRPSVTYSSLSVGSPIEIREAHPNTVVSIIFSDGGMVKVPCSRFIEAAGTSFFRVVLGGSRPIRIQVCALRSCRRQGSVDLKKTIRETYRELAKLFGFVVGVSSTAAFLLGWLFDLSVSLPALYLGGMTAASVFLVELFFPGTVIQSHYTSTMNCSDDQYLGVGDWKVSILSLEASCVERVESSSPAIPLPRKLSNLSSKVPKCFLVAENGNVAKATERFEATTAWRREMGVDSILSVPQTNYSTIKKYYHQYLHKRDKLGHPVYFQRIASIDMKQLQKLGVSQDDLFRHYLFAMEFTLNYVANAKCNCSACMSSDTQKLFIVLDARGIGMKDVSGEGAEFIRKCTGIMQRHYPQRSYKIFFVNVPSWFGMVWKGIKPLLNETTRAKTNILSENDTPAGLLAHIEAESLPVEFGGNCACVGGCEDGSSFQKAEQNFVDSVVLGRPLSPGLTQDCNLVPRPSDGGETFTESDVENAKSRYSASGTDGATIAVDDDDVAASLVPADLFRDEVVRAGYLLKRPVTHKHFTPIWNRRFFILHPDSVRFGKAPRSEVYQIIPLTADSTVRKTQKGTNTFEIVTPLMAKNGHSLILYAPTITSLNKWVDAIQLAIEKLAPAPDMPFVPGSPTGNAEPSHTTQNAE